MEKTHEQLKHIVIDSIRVYEKYVAVGLARLDGADDVEVTELHLSAQHEWDVCAMRHGGYVADTAEGMAMQRVAEINRERAAVHSVEQQFEFAY